MRKEEKKKLKKLYIKLAIMIFLIIFIDQLSKVLVIHYGEITWISDNIVLKPTEMQNGMYDVFFHILVIVFISSDSHYSFYRKIPVLVQDNGPVTIGVPWISADKQAAGNRLG